MKVLTAEQMRSVDRLTIESGIPSLILMENAAHRVVEFLHANYAPLRERDVAVFCGKGNNGGDGYAIARQFWVGRLARSLQIVEVFDPGELKGDAALNRQMLIASGFSPGASTSIADGPQTLIVDAILGTGLTTAASGPALEAIQRLNRDYSHAIKVAVDLPSGMPSDTAALPEHYVCVDSTVTFTAPKYSQVFGPACYEMGRLHIAQIGTPEHLYSDRLHLSLNLSQPGEFAKLFGPRPADSNKGLYGHVLVCGGSPGKSGAPAMTSLGAYRIGAGLVTAAVPPEVMSAVNSYRPELMTLPLDNTDRFMETVEHMTVTAIGPGLGTEAAAKALVGRLWAESSKPLVVDADGLNVLAPDFAAKRLAPTAVDRIRILTPHPGEMSRLTGKSTADVQADRLETARSFAKEFSLCLVFKGDRSLVAFPDGTVWVNPTGSPAMSTGGTGDILTGMIAGLVAQHPAAQRGAAQTFQDWRLAVIAAVWIHGRCGELAAARMGEASVLATDLLEELPRAIREVQAAQL